MRTLKLQTPRMTGLDVSAWQQFLTVQKTYSDVVDGVFGPLSAQGTRDYQTAKGLQPVDGIAGPGTFSQAVLDGFESPAGRVAIPGMDTNRDCTKFIPCITAAGMKFVARYYSSSKSKAMKKPEALALSNAGLQVVVVFQESNNQIGLFSADVGRQQAAKALSQASAVGQPSGSAIYFAADFDPSPDDVRGSLSDYFRAVAAAFAVASPRYAVGVYGSGLTCRLIRDAGLATFTWLSCSTGFRESEKFRPQATMVQTPTRTICDTKLSIDDDIAQSQSFGAFHITS